MTAEDDPYEILKRAHERLPFLVGLCAEAARKIDYDKPKIPFLNSGYSKDGKTIYVEKERPVSYSEAHKMAVDYELAVFKEQTFLKD